MLVNLYKSKTPVAVFSFPILIGLLGLPLLFVQKEVVPGFFEWQTNWVSWVMGQTVVHYFSAIFILYFGAIELNRIVNSYGFHNKNTYLPGLIYAIAIFSFGQIQFSTVLLASVFLIFGLGYLFRINRQDSAIASVFMSSVLFGVATVLEPLLMPVMLLAWFTLVIFRSFIWREWVMMLLGGLIPWAYHYGLHYTFTGSWFVPFDGLTIVDFSFQPTVPELVFNGFVIILIFYTVWKFLVLMNAGLLVFKKRSRVLFNFVWLTFVSFVLGWLLYDQFILAISIPLAVMVAVQMLNNQRELFANITLFLWIGLAIWSQFG